MSGNHDYPPASRRGRGNRAGDRPPRSTATHLRHLRDLLTSDRSRDTSARALETLNREINHYRRSQDRPAFEESRGAVDRQVPQIRPRREAHGRFPRHPHPAMQRLQTLNVTVVDPDTNTPDSSRSPGGSSRRRTPSGSRSGQELGNRESSTASLLDEPVPLLSMPPVIPQPLGEEEEEDDDLMDRWRVKRRKLDSDDNREGPQRFRYGHYGQVVPGALNMEMESCDGGLFEPEGELASPMNVLHNDSSFYSTKSDRCNIILKHRGESPFSLKRIVIKAPKNGYDGPLRMQEGMVFVAMGSEELVAQATDYQYHHTHRRQRRYRRSGMQPSQEYLNSYRAPLRTLQRAGLSGRESNSESGPNPTHADGRPRPISDFRVTMDYDERSERSDCGELDFGGPTPSSVADIDWLAVDNEIEEDPISSDSDFSDSDLEIGDLSSVHQRRRELQRQVRVMRRQYAIEEGRLPRRPPAPSTYHPSSSSGPAQTPEPGPFMAHACFSIERTKNVVNIKFDPPPSGRYILVQLWCPHGDTSIDIQNIAAYGFAGPRFFPAGTFR
ncbi:uncharacterized protein KD926_008461 [Aspergillus affinis]|uniref:uncharacterized protein n=1 Tax=Aspergillus affinis TaxID=1070780 RepID=UPI0022FF16A7|nr:uncharacterized protein KD926_008461 [Aspergillus affinis]KAI9040260.1 hypothetical protein KD926_008461 [Aspergillus affinis]